ncbi:ABC transporter ATP-binding protein [Clostridium estertheticum]|uniref:ABC transporter ATP-binding protein n=1 Tax=Clostridium estertheticum TaxID=238834 RepID=UPI001C6EFE5D|nr:ABC transporter ATP-binding protein [Clostridium estertheticum]MBW9152943.1 ABC transporter ATP-binding protein [Clostridium estertheticum]MCB2307012.1 ABC transporter ATP-binding protein [Clostridium estertheticum]MCB2345820.1 ABC transporter ATP-binding protein [Clostridium estertheticum]MCB2350588.1 ABC transporter ATP-binding protein [Clostridium estertheticum]WAG45494.1 ABC transporter ATP-binding protein [Clostridium estertheticum]
MTEVLKIENLRKVYGSKFGGVKYTALDNINLKVENGEFVAIMGPSGSGKTTFLNVISTIDKPTSGSVLISGDDITKLKEPNLSKFRREKLGFIFQDFNLLDTMTLKENIVLPLALSKTPYKTIKAKLQEISIKLGINDILNKYPYEVSGGQKQRAAAARAMITQPSMVLADEPTGALDSKASKELLGCLENLNDKNKATIIMVTHDAFAASYCKRIIFIKDGKLFNEIYKGDKSRKDFYQNILKILSVIGGDTDDLN